MRRLLSSIIPALIVLLLGAGSASADLGKLDPRARVALALVRDGASPEARRDAGAAIHGEDMIDAFIVGPVHRFELEAAGAIVRTELPGIHTVYIPAAAVEAVAALGGVERIQGAAPIELELDSSVPTTGAHLLRGPAPTFTGYSGGGVLIGDVDSGVDSDHSDFRDQLGNSRLVSLWDQSLAAGPAPLPYGYGTECTTAQLTAGTCGQADVSGHGTHVLGIAGGDGSSTGGAVPAFTYVGMAPQAMLCMVKTNFQTTGVLDGVAYIFDRATALGVPAVVNLSLGSHFGPHDGTSAFEAGLSALTGPGRIIVKSAGNERGQARHAEVFAAGAGTNVTKTVTGSGVGRVFAIDGYYEATENLSVQITTPNGTVVGPIALGGVSAAYPGTVTANGRVYLENGLATTATGDPEVYIEVNVQSGQNMNGTWTYTFIPVTLGPANGEVDLWRFFNSTGTTANFVVGNQATEELVSEPGNALELITTASWASKRFWTDCNGFSLNFTGGDNPGNLSSFSSPGPTRDGRQKPDIAAPGAVIGSATSFDIIQTCAAGGSLNLPDGLQHTINQGTSMAAPHTSGAAALIMQKYGNVTPAFIKAFLNGRAVVDAFTGPTWNKDWGNGKLHLGDMVDPAITVLAPNGGEVHQVGSVVNLDWNATDALGGVTGVDLELSRTGAGGPWETIATGIPNTGTYAWLAAGTPTTQAVLRARASDAAGNQGEDSSDQEWSIEQAVPATLAFYEGESTSGGVELRWRMGDRGTTGRVTIERSALATDGYEEIAVERRTEGEVEYALDRSAVAGTTYYYRLILATQDGGSVVLGPITVRTDGAFTEFALGAIAPNPSTSGPVDIAFSVARDADIRLSVYDIRGREVAKLVAARHAPGRYTARWNREVDGARAAAGLYFVRFVSPAGERSGRIVVTR